MLKRAIFLISSWHTTGEDYNEDLLPNKTNLFNLPPHLPYATISNTRYWNRIPQDKSFVKFSFTNHWVQGAGMARREYKSTKHKCSIQHSMPPTHDLKEDFPTIYDKDFSHAKMDLLLESLEDMRNLKRRYSESSVDKSLH